MTSAQCHGYVLALFAASWSPAVLLPCHLLRVSQLVASCWPFLIPRSQALGSVHLPQEPSAGSSWARQPQASVASSHWPGGFRLGLGQLQLVPGLTRALWLELGGDPGGSWPKLCSGLQRQLAPQQRVRPWIAGS
jgi:hypothetical protein